MPPSPSRRRILQYAGALSLTSLARPLAPARAAATLPEDDLCVTPNPRAERLFIPSDTGYLSRLAPNGSTLTLRAGAAEGVPAGITHGPLAFAALHEGRRYTNPTLVWRRGERVRIEMVNGLDQPTVTHWHGLQVDTRNDGNGSFLVAPGERYRYEFEVRERAGLYWYHPHPHGQTAAQAYRGLYGLIQVEDEDERALRSALALEPGRTEIPLVFQDRRPGTTYAPSPRDHFHGLFGDEMFVNGSRCGSYLDVATRLYRLRLLNACNARTLLLALRTPSGASVPFTLIGTDGGLLAAPVRCEQLFLATAERIDILVDLTDAVPGDSVVLETLGFDPMRMVMPEGAATGVASDPAPSTHATMDPAAKRAAGDPAAVFEDHASRWPEGARRALLELRVRERVAYDRKIPARLSTSPLMDITDAKTRSFRLGFNKGRWRINDRVFAMGETPIEVARGSREVWLVRNYHNSMPHAMHLHAFHFEVLERETSPDRVAALAVDPKGRLATDTGRKDTILVWPGESVRLAIDFALPFAGEQTYLFHCHNLEHEDGGMMLGMKVT